MNKIKIIVIYEILGRPKEYIKTTLEQLIDRIGENTGIKIIERKVHEPHLLDEEKIKNVEDNKEVFSTFAEVELEVDNLIIVFNLILNTLPSSIEIIKPSELILKNFDLNSVLSELAIKLHRYDETAKYLLLEKNQMINFIKETNNKIIELGGQPIVKIESDNTEKENNTTKNEKIKKNEDNKINARKKEVKKQKRELKRKSEKSE